MFIYPIASTCPEQRSSAPASLSRSLAFTLIELLVAMTVSLLLLVVLMQVFSAATNTWQRSEAQIDAYREARGALQLMARDLSTTLQPTFVQADGTSNAANPLLPTLVLNRYPAAIPSRDASAEKINEEVYVLTSTVDQLQPGAASTPTPAPGATAAVRRSTDLCAVGYFCQWMPDIAASGAAQTRAPHAFALMRQYLNGAGTSTRIQAAVQSHGGAASLQTPLAFLDLFERASLVPGTATNSSSLGQATQLAAYVWDLKIRVDTNTVVTTDGESPPSAVDHGTPSPRAYDGSTSPYPASLPAYVEIRFKALSNTAGRRLEGNAAVSPSDWVAPAPGSPPSPFYAKFIAPSTQQFAVRVPLINSNPAPTP